MYLKKILSQGGRVKRRRTNKTTQPEERIQALESEVDLQSKQISALKEQVQVLQKLFQEIQEKQEVLH